MGIYRLRIWYITVICFLLLTFLPMVHTLPNNYTRFIKQLVCVCLILYAD